MYPESSHRHITLFNQTINLCEMLAKKVGARYKTILVNNFLKTLNKPFKCPVIPDTYVINNFVVHDIPLPPSIPLPKLDLRAEIRIFNFEKGKMFALGRCYVEGQLKKKSKKFDYWTI